MVSAQLEQLKSWSSTATWGSARWQRALTAVVAAILCYAVPSADSSVGLDPSWESALALARADNLAWGPQIIFTAGPLGFLHNPTFYYLGQSVVASAYQLIVLVALFLGIATALRQHCSSTTSLAGAFATTFATNFLIASLYPDLAVFAAFAWASVPLLQDETKRSTTLATCIALGAAAGFQFLVKVNSGPTILVIALALSVLLDWRAVGRHLMIIAAFAASTVVWWLLAGQRLAELPVWLRLSRAIATGYVDAMAVPLPVIAIPTVVLTLAWIIAVSAMYARGAPEVPRRFIVLVGLVSLMTAKTAFGRFDPGHIFILLAMVVVAIAITPTSPTRHRRLVLSAVALLFLTLAGPVALERTEAAVLAPVRAADRLMTLVVPGEWNQHIAESKARQRALYSIPAKFIEIIGSGRVHIDPSEASAVWSYNFNWYPAPVFQTYSAYNPELDNLNKAALTDGPQYVLSHVSSTVPANGIDGRLAVQESPLYSRALLCNYSLSGVENNWALFTRTSPRCGPLAPLLDAQVHDKEPITIPSASGSNKAILASIELNQSVLDELFQGTIAPLSAFTVVLDGVSYRLVAKNAAEPFAVVTPAVVEGTNLQIRAHTIGVGRHTSFGTTSASARIRFFEMSVG
ncbi:hypothetical protein GAN17_11015 [Mycobacterium kubicae]|uniref:hypothetical protein n=1 Tax=Mycobacterium kubicae TaxID=120959 RepID=UPI001641CAA4|nr:hypothetical protein [Mycobacterium kubicae]QNI06767.1 hypothetical protein GAN17_11015 [Mycobacterium kubicae]